MSQKPPFSYHLPGLVTPGIRALCPVSQRIEASCRCALCQWEAQRSQSTDSALVDAHQNQTAEHTQMIRNIMRDERQTEKLVLHKQLAQLPLDQGYGHGRAGIDMGKALYGTST
eukprot:COSAG02_NODE_2_length_75708_cov_87.013953_52_plen_114_part_00